jgi:hypothetical protein
VKAPDLLEEAHALARPCVRLSFKKSGSPPVGRWRGPPSPDVELAGPHLLSFDCGILPREFDDLNLKGCASLHDSAPGKCLASEFTITDEVPDFASYPRARKFRKEMKNPFTGASMGKMSYWKETETNSIPLYAYEDISLPCIGDLFEHGSPRLHEWLRAHGWTPDRRANGDFFGRSAREAYTRAWELHVWGTDEERSWHAHSMGRGGTFAVLGGWPVPIMADYYEPLPEGRLLLITFAEIEPQRQVWVSDGNTFNVVDRIT